MLLKHVMLCKVVLGPHQQAGGGGCWRGVSWGCHGAEVLFARESRPTGPLLALAVSQAPPAHKKSIYVGIFIDWLPLVLHVFRATHY